MKNEKVRQSIFTKGFISPRLIFSACSVLMIPVLFIACEYNNKPGIIYDPNVSIVTTGVPTITDITPSISSGGAIGGIREIKIIGTNLGLRNGDTNWVYFGGVRPIIKDIQDSYITIFRPTLSNDHYDKSIDVSVTDPKAMIKSSNFTYMVETPGVVVGDYASNNSELRAVDFDKQENIYVLFAGRTLVRTDFAGVTQTPIFNQPILSSGEFAGTTAIAFGPGSYAKNLFIADGKRYIARFPVFDGIVSGTKFVKQAVPTAVSGLDFDENGNMYTAGDTSLYVADTSVGSSAAPTFTSISGYPTTVRNVVKLRVVKGSGIEYIYIADSMHVWKSELAIGSISLSNVQTLVDVSTHPELIGCKISSFDVDINGSILLCLKNKPNYSLFFVENDGSITPYYREQSILPNTVDRVAWGNGKYLYLISGALQSGGNYVSGRVFRIPLDRNGAPYGGRAFIR